MCALPDVSKLRVQSTSPPGHWKTSGRWDNEVDYLNSNLNLYLNLKPKP